MLVRSSQVMVVVVCRSASMTGTIAISRRSAWARTASDGSSAQPMPAATQALSVPMLDTSAIGSSAVPEGAVEHLPEAAAPLCREEGLAVQLLKPGLAALGETMPRRHDDHQRLGGRFLRAQRGVGRRVAEGETELHVAPPHRVVQLTPIALAHPYAYVRISGAVPREHLRHVMHAQRLQRAHHKLVAGLRDRPAGLLDQFEDAAGVLGQRGALRSQPQPALGPVEQLGAEFALKGEDLVADAGLGVVQFLRRLSDAECAGDHLERSKMPQFEITRPPFFRRAIGPADDAHRGIRVFGAGQRASDSIYWPGAAPVT